jgi:hypothetical protein
MSDKFNLDPNVLDLDSNPRIIDGSSEHTKLPCPVEEPVIPNKLEPELETHYLLFSTHSCIHVPAWKQSFLESQHRGFHRDHEVSWNMMLRHQQHQKTTATLHRFPSFHSLMTYKNYFRENSDFDEKYYEWIKRPSLVQEVWHIHLESIKDNRFDHYVNNGQDIIWNAVIHCDQDDELHKYFHYLDTSSELHGIRSAILAKKVESDEEWLLQVRMPSKLYEEFATTMFHQLGAFQELGFLIQDVSIWKCDWEDIENPIEGSDIYEKVQF